jgi:hypothetical protein
MRPFNYFLKNKEVRLITPNIHESESLVEDALKRFNYFASQKLNEENSKFVFENIYEAVRELLDSILLKEGFKSYSHQAPIVFAENRGILTSKDALLLDGLRDLRNKSKYYGKKMGLELVEEKVIIGKDIFNKIKNILNK